MIFLLRSSFYQMDIYHALLRQSGHLAFSCSTLMPDSHDFSRSVEFLPSFPPFLTIGNASAANWLSCHVKTLNSVSEFYVASRRRELFNGYGNLNVFPLMHNKIAFVFDWFRTYGKGQCTALNLSFVTWENSSRDPKLNCTVLLILKLLNEDILYVFVSV
jgi:hypothetical protein